MKTAPKKKQVHIMESVNILDRIDIHVFQARPGHFSVDFTCKEKGKHLVFDESAKKTLEQKLAELCLNKNANDANTRGYIEEYVGRFIHEHHKVNLVAIETIPEGIDDHYKSLRKLN